MPGQQRSKVLRVAVIVDGESCEELHQSEPGDIRIGRGGRTGFGVGPSTELEYGSAAEGPADAKTVPLILIILGLILVIGAGSLFAYQVSQHVSENAVLEAGDDSSFSEDGEKPERDGSTGILAIAFIGVIPLVTGATMLRGRRRRRRKQLTVYDGWIEPKDYRKRAPIWLGVGLALMVGGGGLFAYEVSKHDPDAPITAAGRGDMSAYRGAKSEGTGGLGLAIGLIGLVPFVIGVMGMREEPARKRKRKPKGGHAPSEHKLFEWVPSEGIYYINLPPQTRGKLALGKNKASVKQLRKRFGQADGNLRVKLGTKAKGKLLIGQTKIIFRTTKPAREKPTPAFPTQYIDPYANLRPSALDGAAFGGVAGVAALLAVWFIFFADRTQKPPAERFVKEMGMPASFYEEEEEKEEEVEEKDTLEQKDEKKEEEKEEEKEEKELEEKLVKPENVSEEAFKEARGVGVARVLGTYGGPGEGTVLDVIESTENNLGDLFDQGMSSTEEYRGGEIGDFVAGGGGIDSTGKVAKNEGLETGEGPAEVGKTDKKERKVKGRAKSSTGDVFGDVDKKAVSATIRRRMPGLQACYEKALRSNQGLKGKMSYTITINPSGRVTKVEVEVDSVGDSSVRSCTIAKIKGWRFFAEGAEESSEVTFSVSFTGA